MLLRDNDERDRNTDGKLAWEERGMCRKSLACPSLATYRTLFFSVTICQHRT